MKYLIRGRGIIKKDKQIHVLNNLKTLSTWTYKKDNHVGGNTMNARDRDWKMNKGIKNWDKIW